MNLKDKLHFLVRLLSRRQVGHTSLLQLGTDTFPDPFNLITNEIKYSKFICVNPNANVVDFTTKNPKISDPLAIDHHLLYLLFEESVRTIENLEEQVKSKDMSLEFNRTTIHNLKCRVDGLKSELEDSKKEIGNLTLSIHNHALEIEKYKILCQETVTETEEERNEEKI